MLKASLIVGAAAVPAGLLADHILADSETHASATVRQRTAPGAGRPTTTPPARHVRPLTGRVFVIDPGHNPNNIHHLAQINRPINAGGFFKPCNTVGTETDAGYPEYNFTLDVARRARVVLRAQGARVILTQNGHAPYGPCNNRRAWIGNQAHADTVVAIHADGGPPDGHGFAALVPMLVVSSISDNSAIIKPSAQLGEATVRHFRRATGQPVSTYLGADGIQPRNDLAGLNLSTVPKIFIECANMRNASEAIKVTDPAWREAAAHGIASSVAAFVLQ